MVKRLAMAAPHVAFSLRDVSGGGEGRMLAQYPRETGDLFDALHGRLARILGRDFAENALRIDAEREGLHLTGYAALPTYSRGAAVAQFVFVNGRPVRDKLLTGALRAAYFDFLSRDRHPAAALFLSCDPHLVDVNVHPAKSEVRFREPGIARGLIVSGLAPCARRGRAPGLDHGGRGDAGRVPAGTARWQWRRRGSTRWTGPRPGSRGMAYEMQAPDGRARVCRGPPALGALGNAGARDRRPRSSICRWGRRARICTRTTSSPRPKTAW